MKKIAVIFPGIGYTADRPLLYYSAKMAAGSGYEVMIINYSGFPQKIKGDRKRMEESYAIALRQAREKLAGFNPASYDDIIFIGKSIGTVVAARIASESSAMGRIRLILYTPLEETFLFIPEKLKSSDMPSGRAVAFTGSADPWVGKDKSRICELCRRRDIPCHVIAGANHSLETGDVDRDITELGRIMADTGKFIKGNHSGIYNIPGTLTAAQNRSAAVTQTDILSPSARGCGP